MLTPLFDFDSALVPVLDSPAEFFGCNFRLVESRHVSLLENAQTRLPFDRPGVPHRGLRAIRFE